MLKYALQYHGENKEGKKYFTIITDDGTKKNQCGIDICFLHYILNPDDTLKHISYMEVPTFTVEPTEKEAVEFKGKITRIMGGLIPMFLPVFTGSHADFFKNGGTEKMIDMYYPYKPVKTQIVVTKRTDDYHACVDGDTTKWGCGRTKMEAVNSCLMAHLDDINVEIVEK